MVRVGGAGEPMVKSGWSLLTVVVAAALLVVLGLWLNAYLQDRNRASRDQTRNHDLSVAARAQEFYFDHHQHYGTWGELITEHLLPDIPRDPATYQPYTLYFSTSADQWCAWTTLEAVHQSYLVQTESTATTTTEMPRSIASCKLP